MRNKNIKKALVLLTIPSAIVSTTIASFEYERSSIEFANRSKDVGQEKTFTPNTNVNRLDSTDAPTNFTDTQPLMVTDSSPAVVTSYGFLGSKKLDGKENRLIFMSSFSGVLMWWQKINTFPPLMKFYQDNSMTITNIVVQQFCYVKSKDALVLLVGDGNIDNQSIVVLDAKTGLLWNPQLDNKLDMTTTPIYSVKKIMYPSSGDASQKYELDRMYLVSDNTIIINKLGTYNVYKNSLQLILNNSTSDSKLSKIIIKNLGRNDNDILISISNAGGGKCIALTRSTTDKKPSSNNEYKQYIRRFDLAGIINNVGNNNNIKDLSTFYKSNDNDIKNRYINFSYLDGDNAYIMSGDEENNFLTKLSVKNISLDNVNSINLSGHIINTITIDNTNKYLYIGNKKSNINSPLGFINLSNKTKPIYQSIFQLTSDIPRPYFAIPVLQNLGNNKQQYVVYGDDSNKFTYLNKSLTSSSFEKSNDKFSFVSINNSIFNNVIKKGDSIFKDKMASNINYNDISSIVGNPRYSKGNISISSKQIANDDNGTLIMRLNLSFPTMFDTTNVTNFEVPLYLNGFYDLLENFSFKFVTQNNEDSTKYSFIQKLKTQKFASKVTTNEIFENFWIGEIKQKDRKNKVAITENMFSISNSQDLGTLTVSLNLPSSQLPKGFPKLTIRQNYDGFLSTKGYEINKKNDTQIDALINNIYPSELTLNTVLSFLNLGNKVKTNSDYWILSITNQDDFEGTATISLSYNYELDSEVPDKQNFPTDRFTIFTNKQLTGFKNIKSQLQAKPTMEHFDSDYLPSEIWEQYQNKIEGTTENSLLLDHLTSLTMIDKNDVNITAKNPDSCDADKKLTLELEIKNNAKLTIDYEGSQFQKSNDNKLIFNDKLKEKFLTVQDYYPWTIDWTITTKDKQFEIIGPDGSFIQQTDNTYYINVKDLPSDQQYLIKKNQYASDISEDTISQLIRVQGYNYKYLQYEANQSRGYVLAVIQLSSLNPNNNPSLLKDGNNINLKNKNFERKIYIYNFKLPLPMYVNIIIYTLIAIALASAVIGTTTYLFWYRKKHKYNKLGIDLKQQLENKRKLLLMKKKIDLTERIKQQNKPTKRKR